MPKAVERLREAMAAWGTPAHEQDEADEAALGRRRGDARPAELACREARVVQSEAARRRWEAQAKADAHAERQRRAAADAARQRTGTKRRGKAPPPVADTPDDQAPSILTAPARQSRRTPNQGWDDCGKAPASVDGACQIMLACAVTEAAHDTQQAAPGAQAPLAPLAHAGLERPQDAAGTTHAIPATVAHGSDSEAAGAALEP